MKIKSVKSKGIKKLIKFTNGFEVVVPNRYDIEKGMKLKLTFNGIAPILEYTGEFALMFSLSNKYCNFNLFVNGLFCDDEDIMNLYSMFVDYGKVDIVKICDKSPTQDLVNSLKNDKEYFEGWKANIATSLLDAFTSEDNKNDISNKAADMFLKRLMD